MFPTAHCCTPEATQAPFPQGTAKSRFSGKDKGTAGARIKPTLPAVPCLSAANHIIPLPRRKGFPPAC